MTILLAAIAILAIVGLVLVAARSLPRPTHQEHEQQQPSRQYTATNPETIQGDQQKANRGAENQEPKNVWERFVRFVETRDKFIAALSTALMLAVTAALALSTYFLYGATRDLVIGADKSGARELRAYVYMDVSARIYPPPPDQPNRYAISLAIINSGKSWARNLRIRHVVIPNPTTDPFDAAALNQTQTSPMVLGPGQRLDLQFGDIPLADLPRIVSGELNLFYVAWITYEDALSDPVVIRQTQLSRRLNADLEGIGHVSFAWTTTHNCADEDCHD